MEVRIKMNCCPCTFCKQERTEDVRDFANIQDKPRVYSLAVITKYLDRHHAPVPSDLEKQLEQVRRDLE